ncbi:Uncharacterised protein [uncultured archaeon]|nr:Uncharacterised protein [uncultured archaeon]
MDVALRIGLGIIIATLLIILTMMLDTIFYNNKNRIHLIVIFVLIALIIYALGDIAIDILHF